MNTSGQVTKPPNKAEIGTDTLVTQPKSSD